MRNNHDENQHYEQQRHEHLVDAFYALLYAEQNDDKANTHKRQQTKYGLPRIAYKRGEHARIIAARHKTAAVEITCRISDNPAADYAIIRNYDKRRYTTEHTDNAPASFFDSVRVDYVLCRVPSYCKLRNHQRKSDKQNHNHVGKQEQRSALLSCKIRETPDVAESHSGTDSRHQETESARPVPRRMLIVKCHIVFHFSCIL